MLDVQLRLGRLDCVALLADALVGNVRALVFLFLTRTIADLQMSINERRRELVLGNGRCQQLRNTSRQEVFLEDFAHGGPPVRILDKHVSQ